jgi:hypothetical protein
MTATSGNLIVQLELLDPNGKLFVQDIPNTRTAKLQSIKLSAPGEYIIIAARYGRDKGNTSGTYALTLTLDNR